MCAFLYPISPLVIQNGKKRGRENGKKYRKRIYRRESGKDTREGEGKSLPRKRRNKKKGREEKLVLVQ